MEGILGVGAQALVSFLKGKAKLGAFGLFVPGIGLVGAMRLAKPDSLWSRRFYSHSELDRSERRAALYQRRYAMLEHRLYDAIGGTPHLTRPVGDPIEQGFPDARSGQLSGPG